MKSLSRYFFKGLFGLLPLLLTIYLIFWVFQTAESVFGLPFNIAPDYVRFPGLGIIFGFLIIIIFGFIIERYGQGKIFKYFVRKIERLPLVNKVYKPIREIISFISGDKTEDMQQVVLIEMSEGVALVGLVTRNLCPELSHLGKDILAVFVPFSFGMGGYTYLVERRKTTPLSISTKDALHLSVTAWMNQHAEESDSGLTPKR